MLTAVGIGRDGAFEQRASIGEAAFAQPHHAQSAQRVAVTRVGGDGAFEVATRITQAACIQRLEAADAVLRRRIGPAGGEVAYLFQPLRNGGVGGEALQERLKLGDRRRALAVEQQALAPGADGGVGDFGVLRQPPQPGDAVGAGLFPECQRLRQRQLQPVVGGEAGGQARQPSLCLAKALLGPGQSLVEFDSIDVGRLVAAEQLAVAGDRLGGAAGLGQAPRLGQRALVDRRGAHVDVGLGHARVVWRHLAQPGQIGLRGGAVTDLGLGLGGTGQRVGITRIHSQHPLQRPHHQLGPVLQPPVIRLVDQRLHAAGILLGQRRQAHRHAEDGGEKSGAVGHPEVLARRRNAARRRSTQYSGPTIRMIATIRISRIAQGWADRYCCGYSQGGIEPTL